MKVILKTTTTIFVTSLLAVCLTANAQQILIMDSFESGDMSTTNTDGFSWANNNRTSIVTQGPKDEPVAI